LEAAFWSGFFVFCGGKLIPLTAKDIMKTSSGLGRQAHRGHHQHPVRHQPVPCGPLGLVDNGDEIPASRRRPLLS